jgi:hypothetical protein
MVSIKLEAIETEIINTKIPTVALNLVPRLTSLGKSGVTERVSKYMVGKSRSGKILLSGVWRVAVVQYSAAKKVDQIDDIYITFCLK